MNYKFKTKPYAHQLKALELSWDKPYFAYFMEMGTGKSKVLIDNIAMLYDAGKINGVLIIAPKGVYKNWYDGEIPTHLPDHVEHTSVLWQSMINKKQQTELDKLFAPGEDLHVLIMNVEAFSTKKGVEFAAKFLRCHRTMMAIDESTTIKNPDAKRTKHICTLGEYAGYKRILTGSPVTKSPLDLYKQCEFLKKELLGHTSYYTFRTRYAVMKTANFGGKSVQIVTGYQHLPELSEKLKPFSYRVLKDDCLDLPEKTFIKRLVTLTPDQKKVYLQMKNLALAQMDGKMMTTATVMTQLMRYDGTIKDLDSNRLSELMNVLEEVEGKIVIWAHWQRDVNRIIREIVKKYGENSFVDYYGPTPMSERQENIRKFQDPDSPVRFFVGTTQTGGYGITLTAASTMVYYSNGYDLEKRQQSEARIDRIGQKYPMTYIDIYCEDTVDARIVKALKKKVNIASQIMGEDYG
jgi:SNF2 family DNA or RNA helicase